MSPHALVDAYAAAVSDGDFDRLDKLVHADAVFDGTVASKACGADAFVQGFCNLRPITLRTDVRSVVVEDDRAAVMYDLVTATAVGSRCCVRSSSHLTLGSSGRAPSSSTGAAGRR